MGEKEIQEAKVKTKSWTMAEVICKESQELIRSLENWSITIGWMREPYESRDSRTVLEEALEEVSGAYRLKLHIVY